MLKYQKEEVCIMPLCDYTNFGEIVSGGGVGKELRMRLGGSSYCIAVQVTSKSLATASYWQLPSHILGWPGGEVKVFFSFFNHIPPSHGPRIPSRFLV